MKFKGIKFLLISLLFAGYESEAKVTLPALFTDNMVLQQKTNVAVWGKAAPGKTVQISNTWGPKRYSVKAGPNGDWKVMVATPAYGGPYQLSISDGEELNLKNVLIGEVWLCSGQSNMEMPLAGWGKIKDYQKEIEAAKYPNIRLLQVEHTTSNTEVQDAAISNGGWMVCNPQNVAEFSSVAYFFAKTIYEKKGVPIGLIHTSWGGTIAEAWTSAATLQQMPDFAAATAQIKAYNQDKEGVTYNNQLAAWQKLTSTKDAGQKDGKALWAAAGLDESSWKNMSLPTAWEQAGLPDLDGVVWFRKKITIPASLEGKELKLNLGTIDDNDITFFNDEKIGETEGFNIPRSYTIPANQVKAGTAVITVRVFDGIGGGGIYGDKSILSLSSSSGERITLDGDWKYKVGLNLKDIPAAPPSNNGPNRPTVLYNKMINPFIQFAIRGVIWYQGESNEERGYQYRTLFPALIKDWRKKWNIGNFPFYFVQLANYKKTEEQPIASNWAEVRDAQLGALALENTGMAVAIDIGEAGDIHPKNKQEVGRRLALIALAKNYGESTAYSGPVFQSQQVEGKAVKLTFKFAEGGLKTKDGAALTGFAIAGADQKFHWATAVIKGNQVMVSSPDVPNPVAVRYAWANNPVCNLYNEAGLPASPFRTDHWKDSSYGKK